MHTNSEDSTHSCLRQVEQRFIIMVAIPCSVELLVLILYYINMYFLQFLKEIWCLLCIWLLIIVYRSTFSGNVIICLSVLFFKSSQCYAIQIIIFLQMNTCSALYTHTHTHTHTLPVLRYSTPLHPARQQCLKMCLVKKDCFHSYLI